LRFAAGVEFDAAAQLSENENSGPVAQLGARFHGMEEVVGSIPTRSTKFSTAGRYPAFQFGSIWCVTRMIAARIQYAITAATAIYSLVAGSIFLQGFSAFLPPVGEVRHEPLPVLWSL
jgi:hypothetical protein